MLIKGFDKLLKLLVRASWIAADYADCAERQYKQVINNGKVCSSMKSFAMNERIYYPNLGLLTKFPSSTGDRKDVVKNYFVTWKCLYCIVFFSKYEEWKMPLVAELYWMYWIVWSFILLNISRCHLNWKLFYKTKHSFKKTARKYYTTTLRSRIRRAIFKNWGILPNLFRKILEKSGSFIKIIGHPVNRCLIRLDLQPFSLQGKEKHITGEELQGLIIRGNKMLT